MTKAKQAQYEAITTTFDLLQFLGYTHLYVDIPYQTNGRVFQYWKPGRFAFRDTVREQILGNKDLYVLIRNAIFGTLKASIYPSAKLTETPPTNIIVQTGDDFMNHYAFGGVASLCYRKTQGIIEVYHVVRKLKKANTFSRDTKYYTSTPMFTSLYTLYGDDDSKYEENPYYIRVAEGTQCHIYEREKKARSANIHCILPSGVFTYQGTIKKRFGRKTKICHVFDYERSDTKVFHRGKPVENSTVLALRL